MNDLRLEKPLVALDIDVSAHCILVGVGGAGQCGVPWCKWLVLRFPSDRLYRFDPGEQRFLTPSAYVGRQSLPVWPPTLK